MEYKKLKKGDKIRITQIHGNWPKFYVGQVVIAVRTPDHESTQWQGQDCFNCELDEANCQIKWEHVKKTVMVINDE